MRTNSNNSNNSGNDANNKKKLFEDNNKSPIIPIREQNEKNSTKGEEETKNTDFKEEIMSSSNDFKRIEFIGQGSSGLVEKALYIPRSLIVALKVLLLLD